MASSILSEFSRRLALTGVVMFATSVTSVGASAQARREVGLNGCSVRVLPLNPSSSSGARGRSEKKHPDRNQFSAREVTDLELRTEVRSLPSSGRMQVRLYTPKGHLYQRLSLTFDGRHADEETSDSSHVRRRLPVAKAILPVAGTTIVTNSLYGKWKAVAYVDGSHEPCSPPYHFTINP